MIRRVQRGNAQYLLLAVILAVFSWTLVSGREKVETRLDIPVDTINAPRDLAVVSGLVRTLEVRISGPKGFLRNLDIGRLAYELDLAGIKPGENVVNFAANRIPLTGGLRVVEVNPPRTVLVAEPIVTRSLPVEVAWKGDLRPGWQFLSAESEPREVEVRGPQSEMARLTTLRTALVPVDPEVPEEVSVVRPLEVPANVEANPKDVRVRLTFGPKMASLWLKVPVDIPSDWKERLTVAPAEVRVEVEAPEALLQGGDFRHKIRVHPKLSDDLAPGRHEVDVVVDLPERCRVLQLKPSQLAVTVAKPRP